MAVQRKKNYIEKKFNFFYKITNDFDDCYYYGIHSTNNMNDGYMGSGKRLCNAQRKHGKNHFIRTVLKHFDTREEAAQYEFEFLTPEILSDPNCYNIVEGGGGGDATKYMSYEEYEMFCNRMKGDNNPSKREDVRQKQSEIRKQYYIEHPEAAIEQSNKLKGKFAGENNPMYGKNHTDEVCEILSKQAKERFKNKENHPMYGKHHSTESIEKNRKSNKGKQKGEKNPMFGKHHSDDTRKKCGAKNKGMKPVNNGIICKKIHESKIDEFLANNPGWVRGRLSKKNAA